MRVSIARALRVVCVAACAFGFIQTMAAAKGRLFSATYQVSSVAASGNSFHVTLSVKLWNHGASDVTGGVVLFDSDPNPGAIGSFTGTKAQVFRGNAQATLVQTFDVPKVEYERWQAGREPALNVVTQDANGALRIQSIDLERERIVPAIEQ